MQGDRRSTQVPRVAGVPDAGQAVEVAGAFLRQLIPLPSSQSVGPLSLLSVSERATQPDAVQSTAANVGDPAASIVSQAAAILDEETAKGVLAARSAGSTAPQGGPSANHPVLRQLHEVVDNLAALWPQLQGDAAGYPANRAASSDAGPLVTVRPRTTVKPGDRALISMALRNSESRSVRLVPTATDLLGSQGGRIPSSLLVFTPSEIVLEPQEQKDLAISTTIPVDAAPGCYSGLLTVRGLDYLRAIISIDVIGAMVGSERAQIAPSASTAVATPTITPSSMRAYTAAPVTHHSGMMQEAIRLTADGELGNSDAICLLQIPHRPEDVREVLARFEKQLTREARSKLTLEAFAPLPDGVDNQRYEPIFDRYPITGKTYTTANGTVVVNEVQYYNGEMAQLYGECSNVGAVREALAGSGYRPLTIKYSDGRESAIAQFWSHQLTDTSLRPYNAAFVIVAAVSDDAPSDRAVIAADENGASSALAMFDGTFDPTRRVYENRVHLFYLRLLDSTRIAIDFGRERMGTDKRPGTIRLARDGRRRLFSVEDGAGNPVAKIEFVIADDPRDCLREVARAAAIAGIDLRALPPGTEYVYPGVARIGADPVVTWQWRTDVLPRLQRVEPNMASFDSRSEEGAILLSWGFTPKVLGYIPNVRGAVTGVP